MSEAKTKLAQLAEDLDTAVRGGVSRAVGDGEDEAADPDAPGDVVSEALNDDRSSLPVRRCDHIAWTTEAGVPCISPALWRPVLLLIPSREYLGQPFPMAVVKVGACDQHKTRMPDWFLTDELWLEILDVFAAEFPGKKRPHRLSTRVSWQTIAVVTPDDAENLPLG